MHTKNVSEKVASLTKEGVNSKVGPDQEHIKDSGDTTKYFR